VAHGIKAEVRKVWSGDAVLGFQVIVSGGDAARLAGLYFLYGPPLLEGDERVINHKLAEAVKLGAEGLDIRCEGLRQTKSGVAADLTISEAGIAVKYNVYLRKDDIRLQFQSTDRSRVELAARLLKLAGVGAEVKRKSDEDVWYVYVSTDVLTAGHEEFRKALAEIVREAAARDWVDEKKAEGWLEKLERGRVLMEGWPKYLVRLSSSGAFEVKYQSTSSDSIEREAQRFREMGLVDGKHFTVKRPEGGKGYVSILREGLAYAARLSVHGSGEQQKLAAEFVEYILRRAEEEGKEVHEKAQKIIEEGKVRSSQKLKDFEGG
jgi:Fe2+ transport system protein FeoA